jgi:dGTPase
VKRRYPDLTDRRLIHETVRRVIDRLVSDLVETTRQKLADLTPKSLDDIRQAPQMVGFSPEIAAKHLGIKRFLREHLYKHPHVTRMTDEAQKVVTELFNAYLYDTRLLPPEYQRMAEKNTARAVADYIAGMTDRFAIREHRQLISGTDAISP